jgi:hypothetical protein
VQAAVIALITGQDSARIAPDPRTLIVGDERASAEVRLGVYRSMYRARIAEALESQFPHLARHLGSESFAQLAEAYIADEPSRHPSLRFVGQRLPDWLAARRSEAPLVGGLARLEWARTDVFDLADESILSLEAVRAYPPDRFGELPVRLVNAHRVVTVPAGTGELWDATGAEVGIRSLGDPETPKSGAIETMLVWRQDTMVYHRAVEPLERVALDLVAAGTRFGVICDAFLAKVGEKTAVERAYGLLLTWLADGLLTTTDASARPS